MFLVMFCKKIINTTDLSLVNYYLHCFKRDTALTSRLGLPLQKISTTILRAIKIVCVNILNFYQSHISIRLTVTYGFKKENSMDKSGNIFYVVHHDLLNQNTLDLLESSKFLLFLHYFLSAT